MALVRIRARAFARDRHRRYTLMAFAIGSALGRVPERYTGRPPNNVDPVPFNLCCRRLLMMVIVSAPLLLRAVSRRMIEVLHAGMAAVHAGYI